MADAWIGGKPSPLQGAIERAAALLSGSRLPVIAGLGTDVAGARAAIALAERVGGVVDHMHSAALLRQLDAMREGGALVTTPHEARLRGDLLLLVGPGLIEAWPDLPKRLLAGAFPGEVGTGSPSGNATKGKPKRRVVWLCPGAAPKERHIEAIGTDPAQLPVLLAVLRARVAGRPVVDGAPLKDEFDALAGALKQAHFGVAVWSAATLDALAVGMLAGLAKDLNDTTRFSTLPLAPGDNGSAVLQVSGWKTGFPMRTGFGRGFAEHDPWRFDAMRLVDSGEADCAMWIAATGAAAPPWRREVPLIMLSAEPDASKAEVAFAVGRPGIDHDGVAYNAASGTLAPVTATKPREARTVADVVTQIAAALPEGAPC